MKRIYHAELVSASHQKGNYQVGEIMEQVRDDSAEKLQLQHWVYCN